MQREYIFSFLWLYICRNYQLQCSFWQSVFATSHCGSLPCCKIPTEGQNDQRRWTHEVDLLCSYGRCPYDFWFSSCCTSQHWIHNNLLRIQMSTSKPRYIILFYCNYHTVSCHGNQYFSANSHSMETCEGVCYLLLDIWIKGMYM